MAQPGTKSPPNTFPKDDDLSPDTRLPQAEGTKQIKEQFLLFDRGNVADIGPAPPSRVYNRDYSKTGRDKGDVDLITGALGRNPFRI